MFVKLTSDRCWIPENCSQQIPKTQENLDVKIATTKTIIYFICFLFKFIVNDSWGLFYKYFTSA